jgi:hypothetical protein
MAGYYRRFIEGFSKTARPVTALLANKVEFKWTQKCQEAFKTLKEKLTTTCDTPVSPRVSLKKPHQEPLLPVNQSKHEHQNNLSDKEFTKYMFKSVMIKTIESLKR